MAAVWHVDLPQCFLPESFSDSIADNLIRTPMDSGSDKVRPVGAGKPYPLSGQMLFTLAQWQTLAGFVLSDLEKGSLPLDFPDPDHGVDPLLVRFTGMPTRVRRGNRFIVSLSFEVLL